MVSIEMAVTDKTAKAALRRDEIDSGDLYSRLDHLAEVYQYIKECDEAPNNEEVRQALKYRGVDAPIPASLAGRLLMDMGLIEEVGGGWELQEE